MKNKPKEIRLVVKLLVIQDSLIQSLAVDKQRLPHVSDQLLPYNMRLLLTFKDPLPQSIYLMQLLRLLVPKFSVFMQVIVNSLSYSIMHKALPLPE